MSNHLRPGEREDIIKAMWFISLLLLNFLVTVVWARWFFHPGKVSAERIVVELFLGFVIIALFAFTTGGES